MPPGRAPGMFLLLATTLPPGLPPPSYREFWEVADVEFPGNPELTLAMRFNLMHLCRSAPADGLSGLAAKGLTGEGYQGHVFWDTEAFAVPVLALTAPDLARGSIAFRIATLDRARAHARQMNHRSGALYPWRTIAGDEGSGYFPAGSAQYHINAAIAYAVKCYDRASGDDAFVLGEAAPMVFETARLWMDVGFHDPDRGGAFRICAVTGPDEYSALVDDDHYTNRLAQEHLAYAVELAGAVSAYRFSALACRTRGMGSSGSKHLPAARRGKGRVSAGRHLSRQAGMDLPTGSIRSTAAPPLPSAYPLSASGHQAGKCHPGARHDRNRIAFAAAS